MGESLGFGEEKALDVAPSQRREVAWPSDSNLRDVAPITYYSDSSVSSAASSEDAPEPFEDGVLENSFNRSNGAGGSKVSKDSFSSSDKAENTGLSVWLKRLLILLMVLAILASLGAMVLGAGALIAGAAFGIGGFLTVSASAGLPVLLVGLGGLLLLGLGWKWSTGRDKGAALPPGGYSLMGGKSEEGLPRSDSVPSGGFRNRAASSVRDGSVVGQSGAAVDAGLSNQVGRGGSNKKN